MTTPRYRLHISFKEDGKLVEIFEVEELITPPNIALLMRRAFMSRAISRTLSRNGTVTIEVKP